MANIVHRLISGVLVLRPEPAVSCARGMWGRTIPLALIALLLAACLAPGADAANLMHNGVNLSSSKWGGFWGYTSNGQYGKFTCTTCHEPGASNIKRIKSTITAPSGSFPGSSVVFLNVTGTTSFGDDTGGHATSNKICEVCHSGNRYHNYNTANNTNGLTHNNKKDCTACHPHSTGFASAGCDGCHGNPPTTNNTDNSNNTGLVWNPNPTGATFSPSAGGHLVHSNKGYGCTACHAAYTTSPMGNNKIEMGFNFFGGDRAGKFTGYTSPASPYTFGTNNAGTTVLRRNTYTNTCENLYCHGGGDSLNAKARLAGGNKTNPSWVAGSGEASCGTCHGVTFSTYTSTAKHDRHLNPILMSQQLTCSKCHGVITNNDHVNGSVFWKLSTSWNRIGGTATYNGSASSSTGALAPSGSFSTCNNFYCHSNGNGAYPTIPNWSGSLPADCSGCHGANRSAASQVATNVHLAHINYSSTTGRFFGCAECHAATASSDTAISTAANHVDYNVNVKFDNSINKNTDKPTYNAITTTGVNGLRKTPLTAVGNCNNVYCHSTGNLTAAMGNLSSASGQKYKSIAWNAAVIDCADCHGDGNTKAHSTYPNGGTGGITANSHVKHVEGSVLSCDYCHIDTTADTTIPPTKVKTSAGKHLNRVENVRFKAFGGYTGNYITGSKTCSSTYCHGSAPSVAWGGTTNCGSCHSASNDGNLSVNATTGHKVHFDTATVFHNLTGNNKHTTATFVYGCKNCHPTASHSIGAENANSAARVDGTKLTNAQYTPGAGGPVDGKGFKYTNGTCNNNSCHQNGLGANAVASTVWNGAKTGSCGVCHNKRGDAAPSWSTPHTVHLNNYSSNTLVSNCNACHDTVAASNTALQATVAARDSHPNGTKNVSFNATNVGGTWSGTQCQNTYCHSNGQSGTGSHGLISWSGSMTCESCHYGNRTYANKISSNAHLAHINYTSSIGKYIACGECHMATVAIASDTVIGTKSRHTDKLVAVKFDNAINLNADSPTYNATSTTGAAGATKNPGTATGSCANVYCHSNGNINGTTPTYTPLTWNSATIGCDGCHGSAGNVYSIFGNGGAGTPTANSHQKHVGSSVIFCSACHIDTVSMDGIAPTKVVANGKHINRVENVRFKSAYGGYTGNYNSGAKTCSSTYCHGAAASLAWGGSTYCNSCHAAKSNDAFWASNSAHKLHVSADLQTTFNNMSGNVSTAGTYRFTCSACHDPASVTHSGGVATGFRAAQVAFGRYTGIGAGATAYNEGTTQAQLDNGYEWTNGGNTSCQTSYCHSNGQVPRTNGTLAVNWATTTSSGSCSICHGNGTAGNALSGRHEKHVNNVNYLGSNIKCADCHEKTLTAGTDFTVADKRLHVNKFRDYSGSKAYKAGFNTGNKDCSNTYCHSNGKQGTGASYVATVNWNTVAQFRYSCKSCHGNVSSTYGEPGYGNGGVGTTANNHTIHVVNKQITCDKCHRNTVKLNSYTTLLATNTAHLNKNIQDVAFNSYSVAGRGYTTGSKTCTNIYCHSNGKGGYVNPIWGQSGLNCGGCHAINTLSVGHRFHIYTSAVPTLFNYTANKSTNLRYNYGCAVCHPVASTGHSNGTVELYFASNEAGTGYTKQKNTAITGGSPGPAGTAAGTYGTSGSNVKCFNVYCHSNGYAGASFKYYTSPNWYGTFPYDKCAMCHGNSPNSNRAGDNKPMVGSPTHYNNNWLGTGAAGGHLMGIHAMKIAKGNPFVGRLTPSNVEPSSHGVASSSTTINCDTCHYSVVQNPRNDNNAFCVTCHNGQGNPASIYDKSKHVNGSVQVTFKPTTVYSKAQLRDASFKWISSSTLWHRNNGLKANNSYDSSKQNLNTSTYAGGNCTTICHFNVSVPWSNLPTAATCNSCHTTM